MPTNHFSTRPLYLQLRDALAERVAAGEWKPGTAIPNEGDLAREFGVSAGTMRKALDLLEDEHLVTRRQGRGTFVNDQNSEELAVRFCNVRKPDGRRIVSRFRHVSLSEATASEMECARLQITPQGSGVSCRAHPVGPGASVHGGDAVDTGRAVPGLRRLGGLRCPTSPNWRSATASCSARPRSAFRSRRPAATSPRRWGSRSARRWRCSTVWCSRSMIVGRSNGE